MQHMVQLGGSFVDWYDVVAHAVLLSRLCIGDKEQRSDEHGVFIRLDWCYHLLLYEIIKILIQPLLLLRLQLVGLVSDGHFIVDLQVVGELGIPRNPDVRLLYCKEVFYWGTVWRSHSHQVTEKSLPLLVGDVAAKLDP